MAAATINLYSPAAYVDGPPHAALAELRRTTPVYWQDIPGQPGYWAVLKHADVMSVARQPLLYSASEGGVMLEDAHPVQLERMRNMLLAMDPPRHVDYRRPLSPSFKAKVIAGLEDRVRSICRQIFARVGRGEVEFVHDVTSSLPSQVVGELVGIPEEDWPKIHRWSEMSTTSQDPDFQRQEGEVLDPVMAMAMYAIEFASRRRQEAARSDLTSLILGTEFGGQLMTDVDFSSFFVQLVTAGNDTTKTMLSSGLLALLQHPDQLDQLRADRSLISGAVEEILRWANPLHYFRRTATADTEVRGVQIGEGDKVAMYYTSANRDEDVFDNAEQFNIRRHPNPHLSFGYAEHYCLGVHVARLEGRVFFEELLAEYSTIELTGDPVRVRSNLNNALKILPIRLG
jgi:cholest-4-en-3-one 26-monooxygenase